jgi:hypothetical protein
MKSLECIVPKGLKVSFGQSSGPIGPVDLADFAVAREENGQAVFMDGTGAHCSIGDAAMRRALEILIAR